MTLNELRALAAEFFEWPIAHNKSTVTMTSALLFAQHVLEKHGNAHAAANSAGVDALRDAAQQALEALESCGSQHPSDGGRQWYDDKLVEPAIAALRAALAKSERKRRTVKERLTDDGWKTTREYCS